MAKIKYDVKGVESKGDRPVPKPGVYRCKIISCVDAKPSGKDRRLEVQYEIQGGDTKGYRLYDYINLESEASAWKLAQFIRACGLPEKGSLDLEKLVGVALNVRTRVENSEQYGTSAKPASLMPLDADGDDDEDEEDLTEDEEDTDEEESEDDADEEEDEEDEDDEDDDEEEWTEEELAELSSKELKGVAEEFELEIPGKLTAKAKAKLIADILEAQGGEEDEDEDEDDEDTPDYESMELTELKKLCKERKLSTKGTKKVLVARLEKDDDPFA